jgi:hypothetical protein
MCVSRTRVREKINQNDTTTHRRMSGYLEDLSEEQAAALKDLKKKAKSLSRQEGSPLTGTEYVSCTRRAGLTLFKGDKEFLNDRLYLRFLRARKFDVEKALDMFVTALLWRRDFCPGGVASIQEEQIIKEASKELAYFFGYDADGKSSRFLNTPASALAARFASCCVPTRMQTRTCTRVLRLKAFRSSGCT